MWSKGICWIDDCRIPFVDEGDKNKTLNSVWTIDEESKQSEMGFGTKKIGNVSKDTGRFPANILVCDDMLNDGVISGENKIQTIIEKNKGSKIYGSGSGLPAQGEFQVKYDKGTNSRYYDIDKWFEKIITT